MPCTALQVFSMEYEFSRPFFKWTDWKGVHYNLRNEWKYVTGPAETRQGCTPGVRDEHTNGLTPEAFLNRVNEGKADDCRLTLDEVLAIRLYSVL